MDFGKNGGFEGGVLRLFIAVWLRIQEPLLPPFMVALYSVTWEAARVHEREQSRAWSVCRRFEKRHGLSVARVDLHRLERDGLESGLPSLADEADLGRAADLGAERLPVVEEVPSGQLVSTLCRSLCARLACSPGGLTVAGTDVGRGGGVYSVSRSRCRQVVDVV